MRWESMTFGCSRCQRFGMNNSFPGDLDTKTLLSWFKVLDPTPENQRRSATCHQVGKNLLIIGGNNPMQGQALESSECDIGLVKVFNMNTKSVGRFIPQKDANHLTNYCPVGN